MENLKTTEKDYCFVDNRGIKRRKGDIVILDGDDPISNCKAEIISEKLAGDYCLVRQKGHIHTILVHIDRLINQSTMFHIR